MFLTVSHFFNVLIFLDLTLAILSCILLIKLPLRYSIKFALIPIIIVSTYVLLVFGEDLLGRPYNTVPEGKFVLQDYRVSVIDGTKMIELWVIQEGRSRLHLIPYSENSEQELSKAKTRKGKGSRELGEFSGKGKRDQFLSIGSVPMEQILMQKETPPTPEELRDLRNSR